MINSFIQRKLPEYLQEKKIEYWGNGTSAIYSILKRIRWKCKTILITDSTCFQVILPCIWLDYEIKFIDISSFSLQAEKKLIYQLLSSIDVVIWVHQYGYVSNICRLRKLCDDNNVVLIEDACQSFPCKYLNNNCGKFGHFVIYSFGKGKIISTPNGGGLMIGSHPYLDNSYSKFKIISDIKTKKLNAEFDFNFIYNNYFNSNIAKFSSEFRRNLLLIDPNKVISIMSNKQHNQIIKVLSICEETIADRYYKYKNFLTIELPNNWRVLRLPDHCVPWRIILISKCNSFETLRDILKVNTRISSWYPSLTLCLHGENASRNYVPNSFNLSNKLLNIYCDEESTIDYFNELISLLD